MDEVNNFNKDVNMHVETLLSDKFAEFSGNVTALHERKKELVAEFKKAYEQHKLAVKTIDEEAVALHAEFSEWQKTHEKPKEPNV